MGSRERLAEAAAGEEKPARANEGLPADGAGAPAEPLQGLPEEGAEEALGASWTNVQETSTVQSFTLDEEQDL